MEDERETWVIVGRVLENELMVWAARRQKPGAQPIAHSAHPPSGWPVLPLDEKDRGRSPGQSREETPKEGILRAWVDAKPGRR